MSDKGPFYPAERKRLEIASREYALSIARGEARLVEIEGQKRINTEKAELQNLDLDDEARRIQENNAGLAAKITENEGNLKGMAKEGAQG